MVQTPSAPFNGTMADTTAMPSVTSANGVKLTPKRQEMQEILSGFQECLQKAKTDAQLDACKQKFTLKKGK
jgi:hypothetical protein